MRMAEARRPRAGTLLERTVAYLVDSALTLGLWALIALALTGGSLARIEEDPTVGVLASFLFLLVPFVYFVLAEAATGTTVGKRLLGLHVRDLADEPAGLFAVTVRNVLRLAWALGPLGPVFLAVDAGFIRLSARDQRVGDLAGRTRVVREGDAPLAM